MLVPLGGLLLVTSCTERRSPGRSAVVSQTAAVIATESPPIGAEAVAALPVRRVDISDLDDVVQVTGVSTAALGRRSGSASMELPSGVRIETRCGPTWCVDGLTAGGTTLIPAALDAEEERAYGEGGGELERVIRVVWSDDAHVSVYVAQTEYSGGAHANNTLACRTFDTRSGRALGLRDVLPSESVELLLKKVPPLLDDPETAIAVLGKPIEERGLSLDERGFRFGRPGSTRAASPSLILCAEGEYPRSSSTILEIPLQAIPAGYLRP